MIDNAFTHIRKMWSRHPHRRTGPLAAVSGWEALWLPHEGSGLPAAVDGSLRVYETQVWTTIIESMHGDPTQAPAAARAFRAYRRGALRLLPGVEDGLESLRKDHALWVATNGLPAQQRMKLAATRLTPIFDRVWISGEVGAAKADPAFAAALQRAVRQNGQKICFVIGDSATQDLALAGNGSWPAAHICRNQTCSVEVPAEAAVAHAAALDQVDLVCGCARTTSPSA
ncbi:hypothetical protein GCM10027186_17910 [Micromonospora schwarzwaldensis]